MTPKKKDTSILGRAMLANVCVGLWNARKHDRAVTDKVNDEMAHNPKAGRYHKRLFGGEVTSHSALVTAAHTARTTHYKQTLPWGDSGWRILPTANYFEYTEAMRKAKENFEAALEAFVAEYPKLVKQAKDRLGKMYRREDYPPVSQIQRKFHFDLEFSPLPCGDDFRLTLPKQDIAQITAGIEDRVSQAVNEAMDKAWERLGKVVSKLRDKLDDGKHMRETMIERVAEVADILGRLNLTNDKKLESTRQQVLKDLATLDIAVLRDDEKVRADTAKKADAILASMKDVYTPAK
jgi:hypothetical protein